MTHSKEIDRQESFPDCPNCGHNVFVHHGRFRQWLCEGCDQSFGEFKHHPGIEGVGDGE